MDPIANLKEQRELAARVLDAPGAGNLEEDALRLAELVLAFAEWQDKGGWMVSVGGGSS